MNKTKDEKTFSDLEFAKHNAIDGGVQAKLDLGNGFEISVVSMKDGGSSLYGNMSEGTYEVAVFYNDEMTPLAKYDDVIGWQDEVAITRLMKEVQTNSVAWLDLLHEIRNDYTQSLLAD